MALQQTKEQQQQAPSGKRLPVVAFFLGSVISYVGDILTLLAIPWFVLQTTHSVTQTGITAFFSTLPLVISSFLSTWLVDHFGYKRTSVIGDILSGVTTALIPLLYHTAGLAFWQLLALVFLGGLLKSPGVTARSAMAPELAQAAGMRLEMVNALSDGMIRVARLIGAPLAGILIVLIGTSNLLWFDALSFALSALLIGLFVPRMAMSVPDEEGEANYFAAILAGLHFIWRDPLILSLLLVGIVTNLVDAAWSGVIAPAYFLAIFHSPVLQGVSMAVFGGMAFVGTLIFSVIGHRLPRRLTFSLGYMIGGALRFATYLLRNLPLILGWHALAGLAIAPVNPLADTLLQERTSPGMRARVYGTFNALILIATPLGSFLSGLAAAGLGLFPTIAIMGILYLLSTCSLLLNPILKKM